MKPIFCLTDSGRSESSFKDERLDCVVRATVLRCTTSYDRAHELASKWRKPRRKCRGTMLYIESLGLTPTLTNYTVKTFLKEHSVGRFFVCVAGHAFAVVDGHIFDNHQFSLNRRVKFFA